MTGETIVANSPDDCAHACIYKNTYANSPDPKCLAFDFLYTPSGTRCVLYPFTYYNRPNQEVEEEIVDHYDSNDKFKLENFVVVVFYVDFILS